jgi:hypothetical protein
MRIRKMSLQIQRLSKFEPQVGDDRITKGL